MRPLIDHNNGSTSYMVYSFTLEISMVVTTSLASNPMLLAGGLSSTMTESHL